ncbi:MAG: hypothetical protein J7499_02875 [Sphingopyxis sp.]|nr:hypothetical protein [Sphingopyxis sp.]
MTTAFMSVMIATAASATATADTAASALPSAPANHQANDLFVRWERIGHKGGIYLNADMSYLVVQTAPDGSTAAFRGRWTAQGENGFCIHPEAGGGPDKCVDRIPATVGPFEHVKSSLGEDYRLALARGR